MNPRFLATGPPYPTNLPFYQAEALTWLLANKNKSALAGNRFKSTQQAIDAVRKLYEAGAKKVDVVVMYFEDWRIAEQGGPYSDTLEVTFPRESVSKVLEVVRSLRPDNWEMDLDEGEDPYEDDGSYAGSTVPLWWD